MSVKVIDWVWDNSKANGPDLLLMLALADHCGDEGFCYPSVSRLAKKCRCTTRRVQQILRKLTNDGEIRVCINAGPAGQGGNTNLYFLTGYRVARGFEEPMKDSSPAKDSSEVKDSSGVKFLAPEKAVRGEIYGQEGMKDLSPKPSIEPSVKENRNNTSDFAAQSADPPAAESKNGKIPWDKDTYIGKASRVLDLLNRKLGTKYPATTGNNKPSASAKLIMARLKDGYGADDFKAVIADRLHAWQNDDKMREFLRPQTLFKAQNFESYLGLAQRKDRR